MGNFMSTISEFCSERIKWARGEPVETSDSQFNRLRENQRYTSFNVGLFSRTDSDQS